MLHDLKSSKTGSDHVAIAQVSSRLTFFEIHTLRDDHWRIDGAAENAEDAVENAQFVLKRPGIAAVRVVKEIFDPQRDMAACRVIFERSKPVFDVLRQSRLRNEQVAWGGGEGERLVEQAAYEAGHGAQPEPGGVGWWVFAILSAVLGLVGALSVVGLAVFA